MKKIIIINLLLILSLQVLPNEKLPLKVEEEFASDQSKYIEVTDRCEVNRENVEIADNTAEVTGISQACIDLVKKYEGCKLQAYRLDGEKYWTIGYGTHNKNIYEGQTITEEEATEMMMTELKGCEAYVLKHCSYLEDLTQGELDALVSFTYNGGPGMLQQLTGYKKRSKQEIAEHITAYTNYGMGGLIKRRAEEKQLFLGGEY